MLVVALRVGKDQKVRHNLSVESSFCGSGTTSSPDGRPGCHPINRRNDFADMGESSSELVLLFSLLCGVSLQGVVTWPLLAM